MSVTPELAAMFSRSNNNDSNQILRTSGQSAILINGGAATAILALAEKSPPSLVPLGALATALSFYGLGVLLGAIAVFAVAESAARYGWYWELRAEGKTTSDSEVKTANKQGEHWYHGSIWLFFLSAGSFAIGSFAIVEGLIFH